MNRADGGRDGPQALARRFGVRAAGAKVAWIRAQGARTSRRVAPVISFMRAWPDSPAVRAAADGALATVPPVQTLYEYSYGVVRRLLARDPSSLTLDWDEIPDEAPINALLAAALHAGEARFLEDMQLPLIGWFEAARPAPHVTDLELLVGVLEASGLAEPVKVELFERCELPLWHRGPAPGALVMAGADVRYQKKAIDRGRFALGPIIRRPIRSVRRGGQGLVDFALDAMCPRALEIYPLVYANPRDAVLIGCDGGFSVAVIGVDDAWRAPLECMFSFLVCKNGVPLAYGPAAASFGCCEIGINLFPEFRGGAIRMIYAQLMRALRHHLGVDYFWLTRYGMGEDNDEAIDSGSFWFYRKLGFVPTVPEIDALARSEEALRAADPSHRSDRRMLRRLSHTEVYLDLSGGRRRPLSYGRLGLAQAAFLSERFGIDRGRAAEVLSRRLGRRLDIASSLPALRRLAPLLSMLADLPKWPRRDRDRLRRLVLAKGASSEAPASRLTAGFPRLEAALHEIADGTVG